MVGRADAVARAKAHPLARALRLDKLSLAALEATLRLYRDPEAALREIPVLAMLTASGPALRERAERLAEGIGDIVDATAKVGGGALPLLELPGPVVAVRGGSPDALAARLRAGDPCGGADRGRAPAARPAHARRRRDRARRGRGPRRARRLTRGPPYAGITPMPKYDAFGREIGEDTLEGLGGSSAERDEDLARAKAKAAPAAAPPREPDTPIFHGEASDPAAPQRPVFVAPRAATPIVRVRRVGLGCLAVFIVGPLLLGAAAVLLVALSGGSDVKKALIDLPRPSESPEIAAKEPAKPAKPPRGLERRSLVRRANFARALRRLRSARLGSVSSLRVAPERINAGLLTKGGRLRNVQLTFDGELKRFGSSGPGFSFVGTVPFAQLNTAAPERLARQAARRLKRKISTLNYVSLLGAHRRGRVGRVLQERPDRAGRRARELPEQDQLEPGRHRQRNGLASRPCPRRSRSPSAPPATSTTARPCSSAR